MSEGSHEATPPAPAAAPEVLLSTAGGVATITLNRPTRLNGWTPSMADLFRRRLDAADADPDVRAVVVTGSGKGFCAGGDLSLKASGQETSPEYPEPYLGAIHPIAVRKPVIAAVNGACAGAGFTLALSCDVRFAAAGAKFSSAFVRRGRVGTPGLPWMLTRIVGPGAALELLLSGRIFGAEEAFRLGLLSGVSEGSSVLSDALAYAEDLATRCAPRSMAALKRAVYEALERDLARAIEEGARLLAESRDWPEAVEGVSSYLEHRTPAFPPLPPRSTAP